MRTGWEKTNLAVRSVTTFARNRESVGNRNPPTQVSLLDNSGRYKLNNPVLKEVRTLMILEQNVLK